MTDLPAGVTHRQLTAACRILGIDPKPTARIQIDITPAALTVVQFVPGANGQHTLVAGPGGATAVRRVTAIPVIAETNPDNADG